MSLWLEMTSSTDKRRIKTRGDDAYGSESLTVMAQVNDTIIYNVVTRNIKVELNNL